MSNQENNTIEDQVALLQKQLDAVYKERDLCLALAVAFALENDLDVGFKQHEGENWDDDWKNVVFIDLPDNFGQISWHIHKDELINFPFVHPYQGTWDGHSTEEKYRRVKKFVRLQVENVD
jgi:hypothetical protein